MNNSLKTKPVTEIRIWIETVEDLQFNKLADDYFKVLQKMIESGHSLGVYRNRSLGKSITIETVEHLLLFKRNIQGY
jgi:hypothetical protein